MKNQAVWHQNWHEFLSSKFHSKPVPWGHFQMQVICLWLLPRVHRAIIGHSAVFKVYVHPALRSVRLSSSQMVNYPFWSACTLTQKVQARALERVAAHHRPSRPAEVGIVESLFSRTKPCGSSLAYQRWCAGGKCRSQQRPQLRAIVRLLLTEAEKMIIWPGLQWWTDVDIFSGVAVRLR